MSVSGTRREMLFAQVEELVSAESAVRTTSLEFAVASAQASTDPLVGYRVNRIKSHVHLWYALFEVHTENVHRRILDLCEATFEMQFGDTVIKSPEEFRAWYDSLFGSFTKSVHEISQIDVRLTERTEAELQIDLVHRFSAQGNELVQNYRARMVVVDNTIDFGPRTKYYRATPM